MKFIRIAVQQSPRSEAFVAYRKENLSRMTTGAAGNLHCAGWPNVVTNGKLILKNKEATAQCCLKLSSRKASKQPSSLSLSLSLSLVGHNGDKWKSCCPNVWPLLDTSCGSNASAVVRAPLTAPAGCHFHRPFSSTLDATRTGRLPSLFSVTVPDATETVRQSNLRLQVVRPTATYAAFWSSQSTEGYRTFTIWETRFSCTHTQDEKHLPLCAVGWWPTSRRISSY